jgi:hypothetical protein
MIFRGSHNPGTIRTGLLLIPLFFILCLQLPAQSLQRKALFLGNSYTYANNLPGLVAALAHYAGDSLLFDSHVPGGYTLGWRPTAHVADSISLTMIQQQNWDFVILQEQSQTPAIARLRDSCMYPASLVLVDSIKSANPCCRALFYLTWGRRFGGVQCFEPNYCSPDFTGFGQMQDSLTRAYKMVADSTSSWIAPVGEAWRLIINSTGMVLHDADNSHPNLKGSYLAACVFYAVMFGKHTHGIPFTAGLDPDSASILQVAADSITFGYAAQWNLNNDVPGIAFVPATSSDTLFTQNTSTDATNWLWDFGDGQTSTLFEPVHVYSAPGSFPVKLKGCNGCYCDSVVHQVDISIAGNHPDPGSLQKIFIAGPDKSGTVCFLNYNGEGTFFLYSETGTCMGIFTVRAGKAQTPVLKSGIWLWRLTDRDSKTVATGKIVR